MKHPSEHARKTPKHKIWCVAEWNGENARAAGTDVVVWANGDRRKPFSRPLNASTKMVSEGHRIVVFISGPGMTPPQTR